MREKWVALDETLERIEPALPAVQRKGVGKYLKIPKSKPSATIPPPKKKSKSTTFSDFSAW